jgi:hypothetical protein
LERQIALLRGRLADKDSVIDDLRRRLDAEAEERRKLTMILTALSFSPYGIRSIGRSRIQWTGLQTFN